MDKSTPRPWTAAEREMLLTQRDALVEALRKLEVAAGYARRFMTGYERGSRDLQPVELDAALERARAALALATKE